MTPPSRRPKSAIVPRKFLGAALTTAVPACALAFANACSSDGARKDYTFVADVSAHFDRIFSGDVSAHFDPPPDAELPDAADADAGDGAAEGGDAQEDG